MDVLTGGFAVTLTRLIVGSLGLERTRGPNAAALT